MKPFIAYFLKNLAPAILQKIGCFKSTGSFGKIFEILGTMLCDQSVNLEERISYANSYLSIFYDKIIGSNELVSQKNYITALHYI